MAAPESEVDSFTDWIETEVEQLLSEALEICDQNDKDPKFIQRLYETWSRSVGALDAAVGLRGVPQDLRLRALRHGIQHGKAATLEEHLTKCKGCEQSAALERELHEMN